MHDVIIVGAGAAATAAALEFSEQGVIPLILDVGHTADGGAGRVAQNLYAYRRDHDSFELLIGRNLRGLANLLTDRSLPVKLTAPYTEYVTRGADALAPIDEVGFTAIQSFACGGLANAWGGGLYRFLDADLEGFPLREQELRVYYDKLTRHIGISGAADDLTPFFGPTNDLLPPLRLSHNAKRVYTTYLRKRKRYDDFWLGAPRIAVLTRDKDGRPAHDYHNLEFWQSVPSLYSPTLTLAQLIEAKKVIYRGGILVDSWKEQEHGVRVGGRDLSAEQERAFEARTLVLAAGTINTSKIALKSFGAYHTQLPLLENPALQIPLVLPRSIGRRLETDAFGLVQLNLVWRSEEYDLVLQGSILEITGPMRSEFFRSLPYCACANLGLLRHLLPAMLVLQLFFPASTPSWLSLQEDGHVHIRGHTDPIDPRKMRGLLRRLRGLGCWTGTPLIVKVPLGHALHYAGTLPMKHLPRTCECDPSGKLHNTRAVFVADAASFTRLPAKNLSFAMMANAMRIACHVAQQLKAPSS